ncbi:phage tail assembly protein [Methylolobus aquaticus]
MSEPILIPLSWPCTIAGRPVTELSLRAPIAGDILAMDNATDVDGAAIALIATLAGTDMASIDLDKSDREAVLEMLEEHIAADKLAAATTPAGPDGAVVLKLRAPVTVAGKQANELTIQRPRTRALLERDAVRGKAAKDLRELAACCGASPAEMHKLAAADFATAREVLSRFLTSRPSKPASP